MPAIQIFESPLSYHIISLTENQEVTALYRFNFSVISQRQKKQTNAIRKILEIEKTENTLEITYKKTIFYLSEHLRKRETQPKKKNTIVSIIWYAAPTRMLICLQSPFNCLY